jgi:hypothetical protein
MSGIEVAGILLGVIPLVISALEHYAEGISTIHKWWRYKRELASLKRILDAEYVRYLNTCEELLSGIVPDATLAALLDFPGGPGWQDSEIERKLRSRLRTSFTSYLNTVTDMNDVMEILMSKLELDPNGKASSVHWTISVKVDSQLRIIHAAQMGRCRQVSTGIQAD